MPNKQGQFTDADIDPPKKTAGQFTDADVDPPSFASGSIQTKPGGPVFQPDSSLRAQFGDTGPAPAAQAPQKDSSAPIEFGKGLLDPITSLPESGLSMLRDFPEKTAADAPGYAARARQALKAHDLVGVLGQSINTALAPTGIPQTVEAASQMNPYRASGNLIMGALMSKAPEALDAGVNAPGAIRDAALGDEDASALKGLQVSPRSPKTQKVLADVKGARPYLGGATSQADLQSRIPPAKAEIWKPYEDALNQVGSRTVVGPDGPDTVANLEKARLETSAQLQAARSMKPTDMQTALQKNTTVKNLMDRNNAIISAIDPELSSAGIDPAKIRETFGNVKGVERQVSGKSTIAETPKPSGFGRMKNVRPIDNPVSILGEPLQGARDIAAGRPWWSAKPTDQAIKEGFRTTGDKPNLGNVSSMPPGQSPGGVPPTGPIRGLLPTAPIPVGPAPDASGPVNLGAPTVLPLAENRQLYPAGGGSGPMTSAGPGAGAPSNPTASNGGVPTAIPLPEQTPGPILPTNRQLPPVGGTGTGGAPNSDVMAPKVSSQPAGPTQMPASPPQATISPYLTGKHDFAIIPADTPVNRAIAIRELRSQGYHPQIITGASEGQPGTSLFVPDMPTHAALDFQKHMTGVYGQDSPHSIITKQGLVNLDKGTAVPIDFSRTIFGPDALGKPSHSVASAGGENLPFALNPSGKEIPVKSPYEGEHYSDHVPAGAKRISGSRGVAASPDTAARLQVSPQDAVPRVYFQDKGTVAMGPTGKNVHAFKGELSIADISTNPTYKDAWIQAAQEAKAKGLPDDAMRAYARTKAENALQQAGWDGYRNPKFPGITAKFGDADVFKPGEEPEKPELTPHPNAPPSEALPAQSPTSSSSRAPKSRVKNGSGESSASKEAMNRVASEKSQGLQRYRVDTRSGNAMPLIGVDAVDARPGPFDVIVQRQGNNETILDRGARARYPFPSGQKWQ